jgi:DHA2 family lincomycin resistance protein-like MFS transporter
VAGAAGTALLITIMTVRSTALATAGAGQAEALGGGIRLAFTVGAVVTIPAIACAAFLRNPRPEPSEQPAAV